MAVLKKIINIRRQNTQAYYRNIDECSISFYEGKNKDCRICRLVAWASIELHSTYKRSIEDYKTQGTLLSRT